MPKILVIQHVASEGLGTLVDEMKKFNFTPEIFMVSHDAIFPSSIKLEEYGGLVILGGPMGVYEEEKYPWIKKELLVIQEALRQKKPILGICLGAQMLAKAAGGRVYRGKQAEIGWFPIRLDDWFYKRNPLFFQIDHTIPHVVFQWHADTFDIPTDAYRLAWNDDYPSQAFCFQGNAIGLQFHVEVDEAMVRNWLFSEDGRYQVIEAGYNPDKILQEAPKHLSHLRELAHKIFYGFASLVRENVRRAA